MRNFTLASRPPAGIPNKAITPSSHPVPFHTETTSKIEKKIFADFPVEFNIALAPFLTSEEVRGGKSPN
jgi:hypothetical protein